MEITISFNETTNEPLYYQLYQYIKKEIQTGKIAKDTRLPSIRTLASHLKISKNTVEIAYQQLIAEGYIQSKAKSGYYVLEMETNFSSQIKQQPSNHLEQAFIEEESIYDFRQGQVDLTHFPFSIWRKLTNQCLSPEYRNNFLYGHQQGEPELRKEIANYLYQSRGVLCTPHQIILGAGIQQLLTLFCQITGNKEPIAIENPGYDGARMVFGNFGITIYPIELEHDGINVEQLKKSKAKFVYLTPSHQFPCGMILPYSKRIELLNWADSNSSYIIEDDYDGEFRYIGKPIPALQGLDRNEKVIYLGTFSKSLLPAIRMSYMVLPTKLINTFKTNFPLYEQPVSKLHQKTMQLFMENGHWERHIRKMRNIYTKKHSLLISSIKKIMKDRVQVIGAHSGLHILLEVHNGMNEVELIQAAKNKSVKVYPTSRFWMNAHKQTYPLIQIGFGGVSEELIYDGIIRLNEAWFQ
ncbi:MocR-like pyridoxine biosynthesis transcription factor PdxR [Sutcliffiella halmapala]|uniref:MocR-like pyridoxine biosynthesis transcription factor PdxR n=1 Tax=Sutcliffiella halmapala TaxID=79882 RepID=UPI000994C692|nr:PLP-dependent aminotransferase family protein [Sutcliffiella halmapala]